MKKELWARVVSFRSWLSQKDGKLNEVGVGEFECRITTNVVLDFKELSARFNRVMDEWIAEKQAAEEAEEPSSV